MLRPGVNGKQGEEEAAQDSAQLALLRLAVVAWLEQGRSTLLERWLTSELDRGGVPQRLPVGEWSSALVELARASRGRAEDWPVLLDARTEGFLLHVLRFSRPDGSMVFGSEGPDPALRDGLEWWADHLDDPGIKTVLAWWFPGRKAQHAAPPLPAGSYAPQALGLLRADWSKLGDLIAIDHRRPGPRTEFELLGMGRSWLGPTWTASTGDAKIGKARMSHSQSDSSADLAEWSFRVDGSRFIRTALLLRGRRLALLADEVAGKDAPDEMRLGIGGNLDVVRSAEGPSLVLSAGPRRASARLIPLALSQMPAPGELGRFEQDGADLRLVSPSGAKRRWTPILVSWDTARNRKEVVWRRLTVTENWKICGDETAVAYRIAWGRDESLVIYRSLARPAPRAFLGHQTRARFLVGLFSKEGELDPILTVDG